MRNKEKVAREWQKRGRTVKAYVCEGKGSMTRVMAGAFFWIAILLGLAVNKYWVLLGGVPATMLIISFFTGWCPSEGMLKKLGVQEHVRVSKKELTKLRYH